MKEKEEKPVGGVEFEARLEREKRFNACRRHESKYGMGHLHSPEDRALYLLYKNHRGEVAWRWVVPLERAPEYTTTPHHPEAQWIMRVFDLDKGEERSYAMKDILEVRKYEGQERPARWDVTITIRRTVDADSPRLAVERAWYGATDIGMPMPEGVETEAVVVVNRESETRK